MASPEAVRARVLLACEWEVRGRKVGNVHPGCAFADLTAGDLLACAPAAADAFCGELRGAPSVGGLVLAAVRASRAAVPTNANLGIVLLLAPLALAPTPAGVGAVLRGTTVGDAAGVYEAIRLAAPGGLGRAAEQDVADAPTVTLLEAMRLAAGRDAVARQYASDFADVRELGVPALVAGLAEFGRVEAAVIHCQLELLARLPDTLIARKLGPAAAEAVRERAATVRAAGGLATPAGRRLGRALDAELRTDGNRRNPGATADLVAASLYWALAEGLLSAGDGFPWPAPDWLTP